MSTIYWAEPEHKKFFDDFLKEYKMDGSRIKVLASLILFNKIPSGKNCQNCLWMYEDSYYNRYYKCSLDGTSVCSNNPKAKTVDPYYLWRTTYKYFDMYKEILCTLFGKARVFTYLEWMTTNASKKYRWFTNKEIRENKYEKPEIAKSGFIGIFEFSNDTWNNYINKKIAAGELNESILSSINL